MQRCVAAARSRGIPILLTTEACNLRNQSPMRSLPPMGLDPQATERWDGLVNQAEYKLLTMTAVSDAQESLDALLEAEQIWNGSARLEFRKAQAWQSLQRSEQAQQAYSRARDLDACRFRAPASFRKICRDVAQQSGEGIFFLDVPGEVESAANPFGPGFDLFLEHVHYDLHGQRVLGKILARYLQEQVRKQSWNETLVPEDTQLDELLGIIPEDDVAGLSFGLFTLESAPLRGALDAKYQEQWLTNRVAEAFARLPAERQNAFADVPMDVMSTDLVGGLLSSHRKLGNTEFVSELEKVSQLRKPWE